MLLIDTSAEQALILAERLRVAISDESIETDSGTLSVTVSMGIAQLSPEIRNHQQWITASDQALYRAKQDGRNRIRIAGTTSEDSTL